MFDLSLTEEQEALVATAREFAKKRSRPTPGTSTRRASSRSEISSRPSRPA